MACTDYKHVSYGAKITISNGVIESVELGELEFKQLITRHKKTLSSDRYKGYDKLDAQTPNTTSN